MSLEPIVALDVVVLTRPVIAARGDWILPEGTIGTVVHVHWDAPDGAYLVEFIEPQVVITATRDMLQLLEPDV